MTPNQPRDGKHRSVAAEDHDGIRQLRNPVRVYSIDAVEMVLLDDRLIHDRLASVCSKPRHDLTEFFRKIDAMKLRKEPNSHEIRPRLLNSLGTITARSH